MYPDSKSRSQKLYDRALSSLPGRNTRTTTEAAFVRLVRRGIDAAFRRAGVPGRTDGLGSLLKIHFADRPIRDYRSAYMSEQEAQRQAVFNRGLLNRGVLAAGYGLMALSMPMSDTDVEKIIAAASEALAEVAALA